ncbi:MAG: hypothetical protein LC649_05145 [Bacteroidales bacterium]|nr:hypothetical protein [Bacteroidales bacterium]
MKKLLIVTITLLLSSAAVVEAQNAGRIAAERTAYFTRRLNLTVEEAERFWPVYNDYSSRHDKLNQDKNSLLRYVNQNYENLSRKELTEAGDRVIEMGTQEAVLAEEYHARFMEVLPPGKVVLLYGAEMQFKTFLLNQLQERREQVAPGRRSGIR